MSVVTGTASVIRANSRTLPLADNTVDLVVTSPPYFALRSYQDGGEHYAGQIGDEPTPAEFVESLLDVTRECVRVLKPSGSLWVNLGDKYNAYNGNRGEGTIQANRVRQAAPKGNGLDVKNVRTKSLIGIPWRYALRCIDDLGLILRAEVIWSKPNGLPESVTDRVRRSHEQWFHFTLEPRYFSAVDEIRESHTSSGGKSWEQRKSDCVTWTPGIGTRGTHMEPGQVTNGNMAGNALGKLPGSVRTVPTEPLQVPDHLGIAHYAAFPTAWPKWIIEGWTAPGMTVLDPFGGTGTTAMVAKALGRHGVSIDMSADYCRLATWRTNDRDQLAKVLGIEKADQQDAAQLGLFGGVA